MKLHNNITIAGVVGVLYVLSIGPASRVLPIQADGRTTVNIVYERVYAPVFWLCVVHPFKRTMFWYMRLWGMPPEIGPGDPSPNPA